MVIATAWCFGLKELVKTKFIIKGYKKSRTGLFKSVEKFMIAPLEAELQLPKLQLKSQNYTSLNRS
jgi:hypothetical protein